jgi:hypothetical protein
MLALLLALSTLLAAPPEGVRVEDRIDLVHVDRRLLAVNASGALAEIELEVGERLVDTHSQGLVAVATTSARLLGATAERSGFRELRYRVEERESVPQTVYLGDRVALVPLRTRLLALAPESSHWNEIGLTPREDLLRVLIDTNLVAVITPRRAIAFAPQSGGFVEVALTPQESVEQSSVRDSSIVLTTSRRILIFRSGAHRWIERMRRVRHQ